LFIFTASKIKKMQSKKKDHQKKSISLINPTNFTRQIYQSCAILICNNQKEIIEANTNFCKYFGFCPPDLLGENISLLTVIYKEKVLDDSSWNKLLNETNDSFSIMLFTPNNITFQATLRVFNQKNELRDKQYILLFDNLTKEERLSKNFLNSHFALMDLISNSPDIICIKDPKGRWLLANNADIKLFKLEGVEYFGKTDIELAEHTIPLYKEAFSTCMKTDELSWKNKSLSRGDEAIPIPNSEPIVLDVIKIPVFNEDGSRKNLIVLGRNVSEKRKIEKELRSAKYKAEESDKLKSTFLATMSHELRTPLNAILGFSDLITAEENKIEEMHDFSRIIHANAALLLRLIEDLFDISLIESGEMYIDKEDTNLVQLLNEVYESFPVEISLLNKYDIEFRIKMRHLHLPIYTDPFRVRQILTNLLRNALKFTDEGFIQLELEVENNTAYIIVKDSGIGIEEELLESVFKAFRQIEDGLSRKFGGAGLGLSISKKLASLLDGNLTAKSEIGKGSSFILSLPLASL